MFTLKLYRRNPGKDAAKVCKTVAIDRIIVMEIGKNHRALELQTYPADKGNNYETYYVGEPEEGMEAFGKDDLHLDSGPNSWWGWGLLENWEGNTSEHYRPASYG